LSYTAAHGTCATHTNYDLGHITIIIVVKLMVVHRIIRFLNLIEQMSAD